MGWLKHLVKRALAARGYRLESGKPEPPREIGNLRHLALAYEHLLNETAGSEVVPADERRPEILGRLLGTPPPEAYAIRDRNFLSFDSKLTRCPGNVSDSSARLRASSGFLD